MTEETDEHAAVSEVSTVEFEGKSILDSSSCEDLRNVNGDCIGIVHDSAEHIDEHANGNSVLVKVADIVSDDPFEKDLNTKCVIDRTEAVEFEPVGDGKIVSELNVSSPNEDNQVEGYTVEEGVASSEGLRGDPNGIEVTVTVTVIEEQNNLEVLESKLQQLDNEASVEEKNKLESFSEIEEKQESQATVKEHFEYQVQQLGNGEEKVVEEQNESESATELYATEFELQQLDNEANLEEQTKVESSAEVDKRQESQFILGEPVEYQLQQLNDEEEKIEELNGGENKGEENKLESVAEIDEIQESQIMVTEAVEPELLQLSVGEEKIEERSITYSSAYIEENQESNVMVTEDFGYDLNQENKEAIKVADEIPVEDPVGDLGTDMEMKLGMAAFSVDDRHLEMESGNDSGGNRGRLLNCPVEGIVSETEVINDPAEGNQNMHTLDGSVRNTDSLRCAVEGLKSKIEVENISFEGCESMLTGPVDDMTIDSEVGIGSLLTEQSYPICPVDHTRLETEVRKFSIETMPCMVDDRKSDIEFGNDSVKGGETVASCVPDDVISGTEICSGSIESDETVPIFPGDNVKMESENINRAVESAIILPTFLVNNPEVESDVLNGSVETGNSLPTCPVSVVKFDSEVGNISFASSRDMPMAEATILESEVPSGSVENSESTPNCVNAVVVVENEGNQSTGGDSDDKPICQEAEGIEGIQRDESSPSSSRESSCAEALDGQKVDAEVDKRPFYSLIRIPRYIEDKFREQIRLAQPQVDEKSQSRDAIRVEIQMRRTTCSQYRNNFEAAISEERAARNALNSKRHEIGSVQSLINRLKTTTSIEDIDGKIRNMEHMIEHETLPLKEEKKFIHEIKQLKHLREQLSSTMGRQDELQQALDQRETIEERFKLLKRDMDFLRSKVLQAEGITKAAKKKFLDENEKLKKLQAQFKAEDDLRQAAYMHLQSLRKKLYEKKKLFWMYKDAVKAAYAYASAGDREALQDLCVTQVETIMELWNKNDEFRNEYVKCNIMSTLKRLRTLDGRSLGIDEEPHVLCDVVEERVENATINSSILPVSTSEQGREILSVRPETAGSKSMVKVEQETAKSKKPVKPATTMEYGAAPVCGKEETGEEKEEHKRIEEEEELARKAEELRKEEAAAKLKDQVRLEERAKAKEAEERKRHNAEKAQARAELRAQKEGELKEKKREKKVRRKDKKKAVAAEVRNGGNEGESAPSAENPAIETTQEPGIKEKPMTVAKRPKKRTLLVKKTKTEPLPIPLRNRSKRRKQTWMWALLAMLILALFLVGNSGFSFKFGLPSFGF